MAFRVAARTLLHLGAELISSDFIAVYELVKNALDAQHAADPRKRQTTVEIVVRVPFDDWLALAEQLTADVSAGRTADTTHKAQVAREKEHVKAVRHRLLEAITSTAPDVDILRHHLGEASSIEELKAAWDFANTLTVIDRGHGMSMQDLSNVYLTIGTRFRLKERQSPAGDGHVILGEKGVGRLSAMRLGRILTVVTTTAKSTHWNVLNIDWGMFSHDSDATIDEIDVAPEAGPLKTEPAESGTRVCVAALASLWDQAKVVDLAQQQFSKLRDPFVQRGRQDIVLRYNGEIIPIPAINDLLFEHAHAEVSASLDFEKTATGLIPRLRGQIRYRNKNRETSFDHAHEHLASLAAQPLQTITSLGSFEVRFYWYNRRILQAVDGIGDRTVVKGLVQTWGGGLMLYRDGYRIMPYASPDDDWLDLDSSAFRAKGYKVNRGQIIGRVNISSANNPHLVDQTNREGLRDCREKSTLVKLLQHVLITEFRTFLDNVDSEIVAQEPIDMSELGDRVEKQTKSIRAHLEKIERKNPALGNVIGVVRESADRIADYMQQAEQIAEEYDKGRTELLHLAGLGLMVEILAHELQRMVSHTLATLADKRLAAVSGPGRSVLVTLESQLKTLQKRLRVLDPLSTAGRQRKEDFDAVGLVRQTVDAHESQFARHGIACTLSIQPPRGPGRLDMKAVPGMIIQVVENLISNSVYWLGQKKLHNASFCPEIGLVIDTQQRRIIFRDNGPGISNASREDIFRAFYTTKPPGKGKGLGLFIAREIAQYHGARLYLSDQPAPGEEHLHPLNQHLSTFILNLSEGKS